MRRLKEKKEKIAPAIRKDLGLYIHIPFCVSKCSYCDFLSFTSDEKQKERYMKALLEEIRGYKELAREYVIRTVFIGGGTPSCIHEDYIRQILEEVRNVFIFPAQGSKLNNHKDGLIQDVEITIETNPGTLTANKLRTYRECGINRLSIGLQTANDEELKMIGRIHTYSEFEDNFLAARAAGFDNINVDLISALPNQTIESYHDTLKKVISLGPEHISAYSLIIEEGTPFYEKYQKQIEYREKDLPFADSHIAGMLPSEEEERNMYTLTQDCLRGAGYERYEISNYAKAGKECRHNISYWIGTEYIGIGIGASSYLKNVRFQNDDVINSYEAVSSDHDALRKNIERLTVTAQMEEFMFLGLRMCEGIKKSEFKDKFHKEIEIIYGDVLHRLKGEGLISESKDRIFLTDRGIDVSNYVFGCFLLTVS